MIAKKGKPSIFLILIEPIIVGLVHVQIIDVELGDVLLLGIVGRLRLHDLVSTPKPHRHLAWPRPGSAGRKVVLAELAQVLYDLVGKAGEGLEEIGPSVSLDYSRGVAEYVGHLWKEKKNPTTLSQLWSFKTCRCVPELNKIRRSTDFEALEL